jgi:hypothetical protein
MKTLLITLIFFFLVTTAMQSKRSLFCHQWKQFAYKANKDKKPKPPAKNGAIDLQFFSNGAYQTTQYGITAKGKYIFNSDSTKFGEQVTESNGQKISSSSPIITNLIILKLNTDTLIYGDESNYGTTPTTYGHDDYYFVKEK